MSTGLHLTGVVCVLQCLLACAWCGPSSSRLPQQPNVVLLITDDQDVELGSMQHMPRTIRIMQHKGVEFTHGFVTTPICCPSRSSLLTGMYVHNHNVQTNNRNCTGRMWRLARPLLRVLLAVIEEHEPRTFNKYLQQGGYTTAYFGKYLNDYNGDYIPPGWDTWNALVKNSRFYNYTMNINGRLVEHGFDYGRDYLTDLVANDSIAFMQHHLLNPRLADRPFLAVLSFPAPHGPEDPAPQYNQMFEGEQSHRTAAWNYAPNPDKTWLLERTGKMQPVHVMFTDLLQRRRLQTLQSVDLAIQRVVNELRDLSALSNTYLIYTSDHGYHLGQYGLIKGKNLPYEFDIKVPYFMRGPGIEKGAKIRQPVANIDIAPTILDIAGVSRPAHMDGRSVLPLVLNRGNATNNTGRWRDTLLIERGKMPQLQRLRERLSKQRSRYNKQLRINTECAKPDYAAPCSRNQRWQCIKNTGGRWRIVKCRASVSVQVSCSQQCSQRTKRQTMPEDEHVVVELLRAQQLAVGSRADYSLPSSTLDRWETQFFNQLVQQDILEDGGWHQGIFDAVESSDPLLFDQEQVAETPASEQRRATSKQRRAKRGRRRQRRQSSNTSGSNGGALKECLGEACAAPTQTHAAEPELTVRQQLRLLKRRLRRTNTIRRQLTHEPDEIADDCDCRLDMVEHQPHPLRSSTATPNVSRARWTDSELLLIKDAVASTKAARRAGRKERSRARGRGNGLKAERRRRKEECNVPRMNCFTHDADHWRTAPFWPEQLGAFCFCQNSNNNTYWCLRTVNDSHNFLYCEFVTGFVSYYDISQDPYQLRNAVYELSLERLDTLSAQLALLRSCAGSEQCEAASRSQAVPG